MKEKILQEAQKHAEEASRRQSEIKVTLKSGNRSSLGKVIRTKEQADRFMKMLKAL